MSASEPLHRTLPLTDPAAGDPGRTGAKAANLARAARHGLPVLPGFVVPVGHPDPSGDAGLRAAWETLDGAARPLVVRSSSTAEDGAVSSMAGRFLSVLDVRGWTACTEAVAAVRASADGDGTMGVLLQPQLDAAAGGVLFGADPVDGRTDRVVVSAVNGAPHELVGGEVDGVRYVLTRRGRPVPAECDDPSGGPLERRRLRELARLAARAAAVFGGPQDIEFAFDRDGRLWLLQSRPVTALAPVPPRRARLLGPGPVAETLPDALAPLEADLWLGPLDRGLGEALVLAGAVGRRALRRPTVVAVGGRAAADLRRLGAAPGRPSRLRPLNPVPPARRLGAAWRTGRLRAGLPALARATAADVDAALAAVPPPADLDDPELAAALDWTRAALTALHGLEALAGSLLPEGDGAGAAARGLAALRRGRAAGRTDAQIVAADPAVLALVPPAIGPAVRLPAGTPAATPVAGPPAPRELLRARIRLVQELGARLAWTAGRRLTAAGALPEPGQVRALRYAEVAAALRGGPLPADAGRRPVPPAAAPLPAAFRLAGDRVVAEAAPSGGARPAGGGRGAGPVHTGPGAPPPGSVLVVRTLAPGLATDLPALAGLVAETGSPLSHLAILARELGVPTVVGLRGALDRFPPGARVVVDGDTGSVEPTPTGEESVT
ncbi:PEP/pyruvate-binding domain-containing protein [Actinomadura flavalba]|uniref:PEP/pyruvate-binding domain-containing protein n=1 Tax=Actinomadura flavalba TaxID=1120938 RepID=UPI0003802DC3|nr:PEP/pyruvate-binding domain-containing protein [Actinomadura flavalba]